MNKLLAVAVLLAAAAPARAQFAVPDGIKGELKGFKDAHAPAEIDRKPVNELFERLSKDWSTGGSLAGDRPVSAEGSQEAVGVQLFEVACAQQEQEGNVSLIDLVYRRCFSHIGARSEVWKNLPKGEKQVEIWQFQIGLDGTILSAQRDVRVGTLVDPKLGADGLKLDPKRRQLEDLRPKDPRALSKWKDLAPKLCSLRPTQTI